MKKLIPALCMLLVAAALLGTSTFAWFSLNKTVTASTMSIKAKTSANLFIASGSNVAIGNITQGEVTNLNVSNLSVNPADMTESPSGTVTVKYATKTNATVNTAGTASEWANVGTITNTTATDATEPAYDLDNYCTYSFVTLARKQTTATTYKLTASCTVTFDQLSDLNMALRAGFIINGKFYESIDVNGGGIGGATTAVFDFDAITGFTDNQAYSVALLIWFEGDDSNCTAANAATLANCSAVWSFTADDWTADV